MSALFEVLSFVLPLAGMVVAVLAFWALGQWLRRKGHGDLLDRIVVVFGKIQRVTNRVAHPLGGSLIGLSRGFSRIPLFGSKRTRALWEQMEQETPQKHDK